MKSGRASLGRYIWSYRLSLTGWRLVPATLLFFSASSSPILEGVKKRGALTPLRFSKFRIFRPTRFTIDSAIFALIDREYRRGVFEVFLGNFHFLRFAVRARLRKLTISATEGRAAWGKMRALLR